MAEKVREFRLTPAMSELFLAEWKALNKEYPLLGSSVEGLGGGPGSHLWQITAQMNEVFPNIACRAVARWMQAAGRHINKQPYAIYDPWTRPVWKLLILRVLTSRCMGSSTYGALKRRYRLLCAASQSSAVDQLASVLDA